MLSWVMRTCPGGGHAGAHTAVEGVLKEQRLNAELARRERPEDVVCVVCAVIVANPRVVSAYDEMRAAVVLPHQRMEDRLARSRISHRCWKNAQQNAIARVVPLHQHLVAAHADFGG